jgi:fused signal recognition particle receptor
MIYVILIAVVLAFGIGVVLWNRSRAAARQAATAAPAPVAKPAPKKPAPMPASPPAAPAKVPVAEEPVAVAPVAEVANPVEDAVAERASFRNRMSKARGALTGALLGVRARTGITDETWDDLEEALLRADVGVRVTDELLSGLKSRVKSKEITTPDGLLQALQADMRGRLEQSSRELTFAGDDGQTDVWLFVGVNGVGKTTTIGKVSAQQTAMGRKVMMAAGDTFRAAAAEQLTTWAERSGAEIVRGNEGGDPSAVIYDAIEKASARHFDLVLADTAGRLHTKTNLMDELRKVRRVAAKGNGNVTEVLLVIDATTGQNGLTQAREFGDATRVDGVGVTGVVLTKLDGSAKGGIVFAIETELGLPVKLVGLGETIGDLVPFDPQEFIEALFG